jgi:uncharacterized surface protein with fasciclin (FAS1) repeats
MSHMLRPLLAALIIAALMPLRAAYANTSWVETWGCTSGVSIFAVEDDPNLPAPRVWFGPASNSMTEAQLIGASVNNVPGGKGRQFFYWSDRKLPAGTRVNVTAFGARNESYASFTIDANCAPLGSVRGVAFEDANGNGARDDGEAALPGMGWKISAGGDWFACGASGGDGTFGPTVRPSTYALTPIAPPGWRATTGPRITLVRRLGEAALNNDIGFQRAPGAAGNYCGQYAPADQTAPLPAPAPTPALIQNAGGLSFERFNAAARDNRGVIDALGGGTYTVFAPSDAAFGALSRPRLTRFSDSQATQTRVLRCHIVAGRVDIVRGGRYRTLCGSVLIVRIVKGVVTVNGRSLNPGQAAQDGRGVIYPIHLVLGGV